ncbi:hypothetical protein [Phenylobacterium sp.]|uniref:hypothetical protein n=1 Tax=Phenylobacterium sp. TaxID=1871053 RepID=UPI0025D72767|nr:hypothetical protein [Phenylobacterium sp.]
MKTSPILTVVFYAAVAACLWPLYVSASQVVTYVQLGVAAHKLAQIPPAVVAAAAVQAALLLWAMIAAVVLFRRKQDSFAWLVVLLVLVPMLSQLALRYV